MTFQRATRPAALFTAVLFVLVLVAAPFASAAAAQKAPPKDDFSAADVRHGKDLFYGRKSFDNGGPPCLACHTVSGTAAMGGGRLGPDLTAAYTKFGGSMGLGAWLKNPSSLTMQPVYKDHKLSKGDVEMLAAFLKNRSDAAASGSAKKIESPTSLRWTVFTCALGTGILLLLLMGLRWRKRLRSVRRKLVDDSKIANRGTRR